ncbi:MAG: helix-turn-helix transcriptional regulator [Clostridia bacterium]|nr:helix-turn-helix transcriptional regulator [Clostridia bacterium]
MTDPDKERKNKIAKYIGSNIFQYRKKKGYTREELAEKSNLSSNHIYELEMGNCMPTTITLIDICNALKISLSQLIDTKLFDNDNNLSENFLEDFFKLTEKEKNSVIQLVKFLANN